MWTRTQQEGVDVLRVFLVGIFLHLRCEERGSQVIGLRCHHRATRNLAPFSFSSSHLSLQQRWLFPVRFDRHPLNGRAVLPGCFVPSKQQQVLRFGPCVLSNYATNRPPVDQGGGDKSIWIMMSVSDQWSMPCFTIVFGGRPAPNGAGPRTLQIDLPEFLARIGKGPGAVVPCSRLSKISLPGLTPGTFSTEVSPSAWRFISHFCLVPLRSGR